jgi:hypothetical protein
MTSPQSDDQDTAYGHQASASEAVDDLHDALETVDSPAVRAELREALATGHSLLAIAIWLSTIDISLERIADALDRAHPKP